MKASYIRLTVREARTEARNETVHLSDEECVIYNNEHSLITNA